MQVVGHTSPFIFEGGYLCKNFCFIKGIVPFLLAHQREDKKHQYAANYQCCYEDGSVNRCLMGIHKMASVYKMIAMKLVILEIEIT